MSLMDAPQYNAKREETKKRIIVGLGILVAVGIVVAFAGIITGHGWAFSNLHAEHRISSFLSALEKKDYNTAYGIYVNDEDWQKNADKYKSYSLKRFTEDWTEYSPADGKEITSHHVDKSIVDGTGPFGTGVIVAVTVNGSKRIFIWWQRSDGTLTYPTPHIFEYK